MTDQVHEIQGQRVLVCASQGGPVRTDRDASDLVQLGFDYQANWLAVPVERLGPDFFNLSTRIAGEVTQKLVNYRFKLAVVGDIADFVAGSNALRDFVVESNRGRHVWFVESFAALEDRLNPAP